MKNVHCVNIRTVINIQNINAKRQEHTHTQSTIVVPYQFISCKKVSHEESTSKQLQINNKKNIIFKYTKKNDKSFCSPKLWIKSLFAFPLHKRINFFLSQKSFKLFFFTGQGETARIIFHN